MLESSTESHYEQLKRLAFLHAPSLFKEITQSPITCKRCGCKEDFDNVFVLGYRQSLCDDCFCLLNDLE